MRRVWFAVLALVLLQAPVARAEPVQWTIDYDHSEVRFAWDHWGASIQHGEFEHFQGEFFLDHDNPEASHISVTIATPSIRTTGGALDEHLQRPQWFDTAHFPTMTFVSTRVRRTGLHTALIDGDLTIKGVTHPVTLDATMTYDGEHPLAPAVDGFVGRRYAAFTAHATVLRSDYGMTQSRPYISDAITIDITLEATYRPPA